MPVFTNAKHSVTTRMLLAEIVALQYALAVSNKQVGEVRVHDLSLLLFHLSVRVVWRENKVDLSAKRIDADNPEVARVHLLLQAVGVI